MNNDNISLAEQALKGYSMFAVLYNQEMQVATDATASTCDAVIALGVANR